MVKPNESVYMCMSCGNCKRKDNENGCSFSFMCKCGDFLIDSAFASRIEFIGCRSWIPSSDDCYEPFLIKISMKDRTVEIGKWGKPFVELDEGEFSSILDGVSNDNFDEIEIACNDAYGDPT